jgi:hypothetical protein
MVKYIKTKEGTLVLSTEIVEVKKRGKKRCMITTKRRQVFTVHRRAKDLSLDLECASSFAIPAQPGFFVIYATPPLDDDDDWDVRLMPVVGWSSDQTSTDQGLLSPNVDRFLFESAPIVSRIEKLATDWALVFPDGRVVNQYNSVLKCSNEWLDYIMDKSEQAIIED